MKSHLLFLAGLSASSVLHAQQPAAQIPISAFVKEDQFSQPRMSPDGKHLAITVRVPVGARTVPMVTFYSLPALQLESTVRMPSFEVPLDYYWVSDTRLIIRKGREVGTREIPVSYGEVLAMEYDGSKQQYLFGYDMFKNNGPYARYQADRGSAYIAGLPTIPNGHAMIGTHLWGAEHSLLYDINTKNGARKTLAELNYRGFTFVLQNNGSPRFAYGALPDATQGVMQRDDASGSWKPLERARVGAVFAPFAFSADDKEFLANYSPSGGPEVIIRENLQTGERRVVARDTEGSMGSRMYGVSTALPIGASTIVGIPQIRYLESTSHPDVMLHKQLSEQFPGMHLRFVDFTQDGNKLLFSVRSDKDPGAYYLFDRKTYKADMLFAAMDSIDPEQMAERRPFSYKARDGLPIHGYLTVPKGASAQKNLPMVVLPHGGPHGVRDEWFFDADAQFLASRGYAVLQVNYRGSGSRGPGFKSAGYRQWHDKIIDDLADGVRAAVSTAGIDKDRVCIFGASFGGYAALTAASRYPDMFKCAVGYAGVYDIKLFFDEHATKVNKTRASFIRLYVGDDPKELDRISPAMHADRIKAPVLLIHGGKDEIAPKEHAFNMRQALEKAGNAPEWYYVENETHGFYDTEHQTEVYRRLENFLAKHIGK